MADKHKDQDPKPGEWEDSLIAELWTNRVVNYSTIDDIVFRLSGGKRKSLRNEQIRSIVENAGCPVEEEQLKHPCSFTFLEVAVASCWCSLNQEFRVKFSPELVKELAESITNSIANIHRGISLYYCVRREFPGSSGFIAHNYDSLYYAFQDAVEHVKQFSFLSLQPILAIAWEECNHFYPQLVALKIKILPILPPKFNGEILANELFLINLIRSPNERNNNAITVEPTDGTIQLIEYGAKQEENDGAELVKAVKNELRNINIVNPSISVYITSTFTADFRSNTPSAKIRVKFNR